MSVTDADKLAYDNPPMLTLKDGQKLPLHYGYGGLRLIEKKFGSVQGLTDKLGQGAEGELFTAVFDGLLCGLWKTRITQEQLEDLIDPTDIEAHATVLGEALQAAFPKQVQATQSAGEEGPSQSTGPETTTSSELSVVSPLTTSGT